jgi:hypothetical protein
MQIHKASKDIMKQIDPSKIIAVIFPAQSGASSNKRAISAWRQLCHLQSDMPCKATTGCTKRTH